MISGVGVDIIEIERVRNVYKRFGIRFLKRVFTEREREYCLQHKDPSPHLAVRFAAKEAVAKALGIGFQKGITFLDIEITKTQEGKPEVHLSKNATVLFPKGKLLISLSHCREYAVAMATTKES